MAILPFSRASKAAPGTSRAAALLEGFSIEVMPRTAAKIDSFRAILPEGTRVYVAHIEGTPIDDMVATAKRIGDEGFPVMPHVPARLVRDRAELDTWLGRYRDEAGVSQALVLAGGPKVPAGDFDSSIQLLETGLFDKRGFTRLHVAGHPEGNRDIDAEGGTKLVDEAARWKDDFARTRTDAEMALVTQFAFSADPVIRWADRLRAQGVALPIHVGVAGPAKLQTLIKFAVACGVGPSLKVLQKRAVDVTKLVMPYEPTEVIEDLAAHVEADPDSLIRKLHLFPLGGIQASTDYAARMGAATGKRTAGRRT